MAQIPRRAFLRAALTLGAAALAGCVSAPATDPAPSEPTAAASPSTTARSAKPTATGAPATRAVSPVGKATAAEREGTPSAEPTQRADPTTEAQPAYLAVVRGADAESITRRAVAALGGMERFVRPGYRVIVKPNICNANHGPEYASTTNPMVVATLAAMCLAAGAASVRVMDSPFAGTAEAAYARSGIGDAVKAVGAEMEIMAPMRFRDTAIPDGRDLTSWPIYQPVLDADLVINVPIAKHHSLARLTLAGKNLLGVIEKRPQMHRNLGQRIADLASVVRPGLTVVDAVRILIANGPTGGSLNDVRQENAVIASTDMVAADAYATGLFGLSPRDISYVASEEDMGLGTTDLSSVSVQEIEL
jgi:uncharacterized protein (DUF362 family)